MPRIQDAVTKVKPQSETTFSYGGRRQCRCRCPPARPCGRTSSSFSPAPSSRRSHQTVAACSTRSSPLRLYGVRTDAETLRRDCVRWLEDNAELLMTDGRPLREHILAEFNDTRSWAHYLHVMGLPRVEWGDEWMIMAACALYDATVTWVVRAHDCTCARATSRRRSRRPSRSSASPSAPRAWAHCSPPRPRPAPAWSHCRTRTTTKSRRWPTPPFSTRSQGAACKLSTVVRHCQAAGACSTNSSAPAAIS